MGCGASRPAAPKAAYAPEPPPKAPGTAFNANWEAAEQLFRMWDANGNGHLEKEELQRVFKFFQEQGDVSFDVLVAATADGSTSAKQDQAEFVKWLLKVTSALPPSKTSELIEKLNAKLKE